MRKDTSLRSSRAMAKKGAVRGAQVRLRQIGNQVLPNALFMQRR